MNKDIHERYIIQTFRSILLNFLWIGKYRSHSDYMKENITILIFSTKIILAKMPNISASFILKLDSLR